MQKPNRTLLEYGQLLEKYFIFLLQKIFPESEIKITINDEGNPDAVIENKDSIIIFEFTTEYYRFSSLYNPEIDDLQDDLYKLLFNTGKKDLKGRGKKDKGKFYKLNNYIEQQKGRNKKIIPILVTESYIGDYDLINKFNNVLEFNINNSSKLANIKNHKPLLICLDDLETFWAFSNPSDATKKFIKFIEDWGENEKGGHHYNFSYYMSKIDNRVVNDEYKTFFNLNKFLEDRKTPAEQ